MNDNWFQYFSFLLFPAVSLLLAMALTRLCVWLMPVLGFIDRPGGRHIHKRSTPKGGGVAIVIGFFVSWGILLCYCQNECRGAMNADFMARLATPATLLLMVGLIDDKLNIRARYKLLCQILVAALCWFLGIRFSAFGIPFPEVVSLALTIFWIVGFINAFNLIDGIDGLAAGLGIVTSLCMATIFAYQRYPLNALVVLCLAAACLGFLRYNFHPARIFMGDTGSMFIGFMFAIIGIVSSAKLATFSAVLIPILATGVPVFDMTLAIWRRLSRKLLMSMSDDENAGNAKVMEGDREHLHHRLLDEHKSQPKTVMFIYAIAALFGALAILLVIIENRGQGLAFLIIIITFFAAIRRLATIELLNSTKAAIYSFHQPRKGLLVSLTHPMVDLVVIALSYLIVFVFLHDNPLARLTALRTYWAMSYAIFPIVVLLHAGGIYRRYWLRARSTDYLYLAELLILGHLLAYVFNANYYQTFNVFRFGLSDSLLFLFMSVSLIVGERMFLRYVRSTLYHNLYLRHHRHKDLKKAIAYGGGLRCYYYLNEVSYDLDNTPYEIIGIVDDALPLWGQYVYGQKVLGDVDDLDAIADKTPFDKLILTSSAILPENREKARRFCARRGIALTELILEERPAPTLPPAEKPPAGNAADTVHPG